MLPKNLVNKTFGRLTVLERAGTGTGRHALWLCKCECGNKTTVPSQNLTRGNTKSCGCGKTDTQYEVWVNGEKVFAKYSSDQYKCLKEIREMLAEKLLFHSSFEVYKTVKSRFPPITEAIIPYKEKKKILVVQMDRPEAQYSNYSPFRIAK